MPAALGSANHGGQLTTLELKALSVPSALLFLLGVEYDLFLSVTGSERADAIRILIPIKLAPSYRLLVDSCAAKFHLNCSHSDEGEGSTLIHGSSAQVPLLRYIDYLPGSLHTDEILLCLGVDPSTCRRTAPLVTFPPSVTASFPTLFTPEGGYRCFEAGFIPYTQYVCDGALADIHGTGYYLALDHGLSLATHSHLVRVFFKPLSAAQLKLKKIDPSSPAAVEASIQAFHRFSGWASFDLRFDDYSKRSGLLVMPTVQDACDLLEMYEDEESDIEGDSFQTVTDATCASFRLPFHLRPVGPLVAVPCIEDATLRKAREQEWHQIEAFWKKGAANANTVMVTNLYEKVTLEEVLELLLGDKSGGGPSVVRCASLVEDASPSKRKKAFITFVNATQARNALGLDGKNTKGRALRIQVAPPYIDHSRRGHQISSVENALVPGSSSPASIDATPHSHPVTPPPQSVESQSNLNAKAKEFIPKSATASPAAPPSAPPPYCATVTSRPSMSPATNPHVAPPTPTSPASHGGLPPPPPPYVGANGSFSMPPPAYAARPPPPPVPSSPVAAASLPPPPPYVPK